jgi:RNA polymerase-binding transcription factor DksA
VSSADIPQARPGSPPGFDPGEVAAFLGELDHELTAVEETLRRLDAGTYGRCRVCDEVIDRADLEMNPLEQHCVQHR